RHQPARERKISGRRRVRGGARARGVPHSGSGRRRADDHCDVAEEHAGGRDRDADPRRARNSHRGTRMSSSWQDPGEVQVMMRPSFPRMTRGVKWLMIANALVFLVHFTFFLIAKDDKALYMRWLLRFALVPQRWTQDFPLMPVWQVV